MYREAIFSGQFLQQPAAFCPPAGMHGAVLCEIVHLIMGCKWPEAGIGPHKLTCSSVHTASRSTYALTNDENSLILCSAWTAGLEVRVTYLLMHTTTLTHLNAWLNLQLGPGSSRFKYIAHILTTQIYICSTLYYIINCCWIASNKRIWDCI